MAYRGGRGQRQRSPGRSSVRRVVAAGSSSDGTLSSRFARIHSESRAELPGRHGGRSGRVGKSTSRRGGRGPAAMEIDSVGSNGRRGERNRGRRGGRGGRRGGSRRGGSNNNQRGGRQNKPMSKDALDNDLDNYMMKDPSVAKSRLDQEMDAYQQARAQ